MSTSQRILCGLNEQIGHELSAMVHPGTVGRGRIDAKSVEHRVASESNLLRIEECLAGENGKTAVSPMV